MIEELITKEFQAEAMTCSPTASAPDSFAASVSSTCSNQPSGSHSGHRLEETSSIRVSTSAHVPAKSRLLRASRRFAGILTIISACIVELARGQNTYDIQSVA